MSLHTPETIYSIYALNQLGAIVNLIYLTLNAEEILKQTDEVGSKMFLYLENVQDKVKEIGIDIEAMFVFLVTTRFHFLEGNTKFLFHKIKKCGTKCITKKGIVECRNEWAYRKADPG